MTHKTGEQVTRQSARKSSIRPFLLATTMALSVGVLSAPNMALAQDFRFNAISVEGNQRIESGTIASYLGVARGEPVSAAALNDGYQRILASGLFETVEIEPRGNTLVVRVVEFPTVNRIAFEGNERLDDETLAQIIQSQSRRVFSPATAEADAARITEAYSQQGRIAARVQPKVIRRSDNRVDLVYEVFEGGVSEIERIGFAGNQVFSDRRLRRVLETKQAGIFRALIQSDTFIEDRIEFDRQVLRDFYQSRGYVDFRTTGVNAELSEERDGYFITFNVEEGQQFNFGEVTATSDLAEVDPDVFQRAIRLRSGRTYSPTAVETEIARLERLAIREGLNFVRVEPRVTRNDRDLTLDVEFLLTRGERVFVERIDIEGNTTTLDRVVRRQFRVVEGDPFNPREIRESAERVRALGFFGDANVEAREGSTPQQVVIDVDVEERPTGSLSFGGSYSTSGGFGAAITFSERNFLGRGQQLALGVTTGVDSSNYSFSFTEPAFLGRDVAFNFSLNYLETDNSNAEYDTAIGNFTTGFTFPVSENGRLNLRYGARYSEITNLNSSVGEIITAEAARGDVWDSYIGYRYSYDTRRTGLNPNAGVLLEFGQDFAGLGGDSTYVESTLRAVAQTKILNDEVTLRATLQAGALSYSEGSSRVTDRFTLGSNLMRGFEGGGIGPREVGPGDVNDPLGGDYFAVARFEAEFPLPLPEEYGVSAGVFYDVGSLWGLEETNANVLYDDFTARHVIGVSLFWTTPLGPLRFNFSEALSKEKFDEEQTFDLTISTQF
ncbi:MULTISPECIES: outer membrane protein assembly factor BamA [Marivita]|uniref:Outer membrane protein assembly factor BamA n=1 Tax=Marivita cryptomonadis TaxID=505252 RepID=A0A9Q2NW23_9RHOB|nr:MULTISPECIES: outer membrane protein assembly factor BamA [Marivita]MCR9167669.1 outer membrane protein assembly factor BamA [Paracoccaceae bacterium]MBM2322074.1 outer membrane protein assembly factor BamA [Marivita cryptomonadis]MBM2331655.1 outer membrane protein assembly factor BamA [Marivita cryptomonadis]MBM2341240.1 outer membrane protein assembly factor BamA [Marivita cryptomonadis]MBM2345903.1 outer membrane protein assembly factor BamA [Marivita cryptomonadis]